MITKRLRKRGNDLSFVCHNCHKTTSVRDIVPNLGDHEAMEKHPRLKKTSKIAPMGTPKTTISAAIISVLIAVWVANLLDMPPFMIIGCFGFLFEFIVNPFILYYRGTHCPIWVHSCENCGVLWQVVDYDNSLFLIFRFLF